MKKFHTEFLWNFHFIPLIEYKSRQESLKGLFQLISTYIVFT